MATGWPFTTPRTWDLNYFTDDVPLVRTLIQAGVLFLGGAGVANPGANEPVVTITDAAGKVVHVWDLPPNASDEKESNLRPLTGVYMQATAAGASLHVWGWKT